METVSRNGFNPVPAAVAHFVNTMSTLNIHRPWRPNPHRVEPLASYPQNPHALLLRRFLDLLNSVEGRAWISTLPLPEQHSYTGVRTHLEAVLAVGYLIATIHQEQQ